MNINPEEKDYDMDHPLRKTIGPVGLVNVWLTVSLMMHWFPRHPSAGEPGYWGELIMLPTWTGWLIIPLFLYVFVMDEFVLAEVKAETEP